MLLGATLGAFASPALTADLVVHEWGTITTIHAADGTPAGGLNSIDEADVLPDFVHRYEPETTRHKPERILGKLPNIPGRPDVTMRLETPVIYFHPPPNKAFTAPIDITVRFRGGVINEFYPDAAASVALDRERIADKVHDGVITEWNGDVLNNYVVGSAALERAAPARHRGRAAHQERNLARAARSELGERVQPGSRRRRAVPFLSRRRASRCAVVDENHARFGCSSRRPPTSTWLESAAAVVPDIWLADVRADGVIAFRAQPAVTLKKENAGKELAKRQAFFRRRLHRRPARRSFAAH